MIRQIIMCVIISAAIFFGAGYGTGHYIASNKAEKDITAIRAILEEERSERKSKEDAVRKYLEQHQKEIDEMNE